MNFKHNVNDKCLLCTPGEARLKEFDNDGEPW